MGREVKELYVKRTQRDYPLSFKIQVVREIESGSISSRGAMRKYGVQGHGTVLEWRRKYGTFDQANKITEEFMQTPQQKIRELEQRLRLLERQNKFLGEQLKEAEDKANILDRVIEIASSELGVPIRKKLSPGQSEPTPKRATDR
jgi:transposase-like protein